MNIVEEFLEKYGFKASELSKMLEVSPMTISTWRRQEELPKHVKLLLKDLESKLKRRTVYEYYVENQKKSDRKK